MRRLLAAIVLAGTLGSAGCVTPSIPIPPPDPTLISFQLTGEPGSTTASFSYPIHPTLVDAVVFVYNRDKGVGIIENAHPDGSVGPTASVRADLGDQMVISFQRDDQTASTCIRLKEGSQDGTTYCDP
ncbi:MAG: hypothetical protein JWP01_3797 [Myxococcales bacterium]|nr:hypothetical protein [Myxococcales bacterium]